MRSLWWFLFAVSIFFVTDCLGRCQKPSYSNLPISEQKCKEYLWQRSEKFRSKICRNQHSRRGGKRKPTFEIINGKNTRVAEYPHMAAVGWYSLVLKSWTFMCGASLISEFFLLSAAHCRGSEHLAKIHEFNTSQPLIVRLGARNIKFSVYEIYQDYKIEDIIVHNKYLPTSNSYDIALIRTSEKIKFTRYIYPACIGAPTSGYHTYTVTGWGKIERNGQFVDELRFGKVNLIDQYQCDLLIAPFKSRKWNKVSHHQMCAGNLDGSVDTCQGDSGGPLQEILKESDSTLPIYKVLGIISFGLTHCATKNMPSLYTKVNFFASWIERRVWAKELEASKKKLRRRFWK